MPEEDFWPADITTGTITTPVSMMRAQAAFLGEKTNQQVTAKVESIGGAAQSFSWSFQLVSPSLSYKYELFQVHHPIQLYPATVIWEGHPNVSLGNEEQFRTK